MFRDIHESKTIKSMWLKYKRKLGYVKETKKAQGVRRAGRCGVRKANGGWAIQQRPLLDRGKPMKYYKPVDDIK